MASVHPPSVQAATASLCSPYICLRLSVKIKASSRKTHQLDVAGSDVGVVDGSRFPAPYLKLSRLWLSWSLFTSGRRVIGGVFCRDIAFLASRRFSFAFHRRCGLWRRRPFGQDAESPSISSQRLLPSLRAEGVISFTFELICF